MPASADISEARALLERAERESDPEQETHHIEEALLLLETVDNPTPEETTLIANLRMSYARRLLAKVPKLKSVSFDVWLLYFKVMVLPGRFFQIPRREKFIRNIYLKRLRISMY